MESHNKAGDCESKDIDKTASAAGEGVTRFAGNLEQGKLYLEPAEFDIALGGFTRATEALETVLARWKGLADDLLPLGGNPVGQAVAHQFGVMSERFFNSVRDYNGELRRSSSALRSSKADVCTTDGNIARRFDGYSLYQVIESDLDSLDRQAFRYAQTAAEPVDTYAWRPGTELNWQAFESERLYQFGTTGNIPCQVFEKIDKWAGSAETLAQQSLELSESLEKLKASWRGEAADSAHTGLVPLARWGDDASGNADRIRDQLTNAAEAADQLLHRIPPAAPVPAGMNTVLVGGVLDMTADMRVQLEKAAAVKAEQVRYLDEYTAVMSAVYDALPQFDVVPAAAKDGEPASTSGGTGGVVTPMARSAGLAPAGTSGPSPGVVVDTPPPSVSGPPVPAASGLGTAGITQVTVAAGGTGPGAVDQLAPRAGTAVPSGSMAGPGGGVAGPFGAGQGAPGSGAGPRGVDARAGLGEPRPATPGSAGRNPLTAAAAAGRGPAPGHGFAPSRPDREEDGEHTRPDYLLVEDPEGTFGTNEKTAPPVIGGAP